jgi:hypothetical protein
VGERYENTIQNVDSGFRGEQPRVCTIHGQPGGRSGGQSIKTQIDQRCLNSGTRAWVPVPSTPFFPHRGCFCLYSGKGAHGSGSGEAESADALSVTAFPPLVGSDLEFIPADTHAAPPAGALFARVEEVNYTRFAFANAGHLRFRQQICRGIHYGTPKIGWLRELEGCLTNDLPAPLVKQSGERMLKQQ